MLMLKSQHPDLPFKMLLENELWNVVFEIPETSDLKDITVIASIPEKSFCIFNAVFEKLNKL